jgi:dephospho-CoA kinase
MSADEKLRQADFGLINDLDLKHLRQQIIDLLTTLSDQTGNIQ